MTHEFGNEVVRQVLEAQDERPCPYCDQQARYERRREGMVITLQGRVYSKRAYYLCPHCGQDTIHWTSVWESRPGK